MVEIPSAMMLADELGAMVDFMSIGTNDLTRYLLADDRTSPWLAHRPDPLHHPAVRRAVASVVEGRAKLAADAQELASADDVRRLVAER
jgi:phosphoenolpyruvate-protein kinase (PTS system EI component)